MEKEYKKDDTTISVHRTTRDRMKRLRGRGISYDRYINNLMDMVSPQERKRNENNEEAGKR